MVANFIAELKRRNVVKVIVAYGLVGWVLIQVANEIFPALQLPTWTVTFITVLVLLGFPIAVLLAWAYELQPQSEADRTAALAGEHNQPRGRRGLYVLIAAVAVVVAVSTIVVRYGLPEPGAIASADADEIRIAILPFQNISDNVGDRYFAAGLHEEMINRLMRVDHLAVIARTSVMRFEDSIDSVAQIASELDVNAVMEGSVRFDGEDVRVTVQLIDSRSGTQVWADAYDGEVGDIFDIQSDITRQVAELMSLPDASQTPGSAVSQNPPAPQAYANYLEALGMAASANPSEPVLTRSGTRPDSIGALDRAIAFDPEFADAHAEKAVLLAAALLGADIPVAISDEEALAGLAEASANRALEIDSANARALIARARVAVWRGEHSSALAAYQRAVESNPQSATAQAELALVAGSVGETQLAWQAQERALQLDPFVDSSQISSLLRAKLND